ncbi:MAG: ACT domain-containing protein [Eubacteriales bacterium]|nr:ACT domain-containing protein [Eubacteriales bacterium]
MVIEALAQDFSICKVADSSQIDLNNPFCFVGRTDAELSLVCQTEHTPRETLAREDGFRAFRVGENMPFSLVGILARITGILADHGISVFAVSTFDTDYVLVKAQRFSGALGALEAEGYIVRSL